MVPGWVVGTPLPCLGIRGGLAWVTLGTSHKDASQFQGPSARLPHERCAGAGDSSGGSVSPVPWGLYPDCAGNVCSHLGPIQQVPGAGTLVTILGCRYCTRTWI